jgi:hypothetical protein
MNNEEIQVFKITPIKDKNYFYAEATRKTGIEYYTTNNLKYVGKYIGNYRSDDGGRFWSIFKDGDIENRVDYSCEGKTCFVEFDEKQIS